MKYLKYVVMLALMIMGVLDVAAGLLHFSTKHLNASMGQEIGLGLCLIGLGVLVLRSKDHDQ